MIVEAPIPSLASTHPVYGRLMTAAMADDDALRYARTVIESGRDAGDPSLRYANDVAMTHLEWRTIDEERHRIRALWAEHVFTVVDAVLAPVAPTPAFPHILGGHWSERRLTIDGVEGVFHASSPLRKKIDRYSVRIDVARTTAWATSASMPASTSDLNTLSRALDL